MTTDEKLSPTESTGARSVVTLCDTVYALDICGGF